MGQAASYAESSVQRALLRVKQEEQAEEDELLQIRGYRRSSYVAPAADDIAASGRIAGEAELQQGVPTPLSSISRNCPFEGPLPAPPEMFCPVVSLTPEYYTLDELRDALRYVPDTLWVSLYRVSLLFMLDHDHDGRINSTDVSFFMDWGIKSVGRDVLPGQLAEVLQTYAALHCWHRCLQHGAHVEKQKKISASAKRSDTIGADGGSGDADCSSRWHPSPLGKDISSTTGPAGRGGDGEAVSALHSHPLRQTHNMSSFMLLHFRRYFQRGAEGESPEPHQSTTSAEASTPEKAATPTLPSTTTTATTTESAPSGSTPSSPRFPVNHPVTEGVRYAAAMHFAEWMLRLVKQQERDRRHERQRYERLTRGMTAATETMTEGKPTNARLRHSPLRGHSSLRFRHSGVVLSPAVFSADGEAADGLKGMRQGSSLNPLEGVAVGEAGSSRSSGESTAAWSMPTRGCSVSPAHAASGGTPLSPPPQARGVNTTASQMAVADAAGHLHGAEAKGCSHVRATRVGSPPLVAVELGQRRPSQPPEHGLAPSSCTSSITLGSSMAAAPPTNVTAPLAVDDTPTRADFNTRRGTVAPQGGSAGVGAETVTCGSGLSGGNGWLNSTFTSVAAAVDTANASGDVGAVDPTAAVSTQQLNVLLMDSEAFHLVLEANGWCTIGAVEEMYLDFAVEESYCIPFWSFCRVLHESSAEEVQAALELTTEQATAVLTSAAVVEEYRRAAAVRQLQRPEHGERTNNSTTVTTAAAAASSGHGGLSDIFHGAHTFEVVPLFLVSDYTYMAFVASFVHAYWAMLESMGVDPVTAPSVVNAQTASAF